MRINKVVAERLGIARRKADELIQHGRVTVNGRTAIPGLQVSEEDTITADGKELAAATQAKVMIALNKPGGYVCSRRGQGGAKTIYELLPPEYQQLNSIGRLDKDSSGLLLLTNDGELANKLSHPKFNKTKIYEVTLDKALLMPDEQAIQAGVPLEDGPSRLELYNLGSATAWQVSMHEGRNRQIRRTFAKLGYKVTKLERTKFGAYKLGGLLTGKWAVLVVPQ